MVIEKNQLLSEIKEFMFDKKNRLNFRRFSQFKDKYPEAYQEIYEYTKDFKFLEEAFRYRFLSWFYQYSKNDLVCRRIGCDNPVKWTNLIPNKLCSNTCRKLDGKNIAENLIKTNQKKYGVNSTAQLKETVKKFKETILRNNHIKNKIQYNDIDFIKQTFFDSKNHFNYQLFCEYFGVIQPTAHNQINRLGIKYTRTLSLGENKLQEFIRSIKAPEDNVLFNSRKIIPPKELDIYLPEYGLAIEYNGLYWHSYGKNDSKYKTKDALHYQKYRHIEKTLDCSEESIQLLHILQSEWETPHLQDIWKNIIKYKLNKIIDKKDARKLELKYYSGISKKIKDFLKINHLQGSGINPTHCFTLEENSEILQVMTFGPSRYNDSQYELLRLATKLNIIVRGGAKRLLTAFEKTINPKSLHTFADLRFSQGNIYNELGFNLIKRTPPNFKIFKKNTLFLESRERYQKHKLKDLLPTFDEKKTAIENLVENGYRVIWDSGNLSFKKEYK